MKKQWSQVVGVLAAPAEVFRQLQKEPAVVAAFIVTGLAATLVRMGGGTSMVAAFVGAAGLLVLETLGVHIFARLMYSRTSFSSGLSALGLAGTPMLLYAPVYVVTTLLGWGELGVLVSTALMIWSLVLTVLAVREVYDLSTGRAVAALLLGVTPVLFIMIGIAMIAVIGSIASMGLSA